MRVACDNKVEDRSPSLDRVINSDLSESPIRSGELWSKPEEHYLRLFHSRNYSIEDTAKYLKRTPGAIEARLIKLGLMENPYVHDRRR